jgi:uncharacterized protein YdiU (UPF0061 family)
MIDLPNSAPRFAALGKPYTVEIPSTPLPDPKLLHFNAALAESLGIDGAPVDLTEVLAGNAAWPGVTSTASVYAGHQFGQFVPQLGDGRALLIAEITDHRGQPQELQLKGAGPTPYSRFADGRAVLRSSIREYLCSEAMHALGIPTTRALALVGSKQPVRRETIETAAVVCRVAPSFVRFGHFEFWYYRGEHERLAPLADHVIDTHFPQLSGRADRYGEWLGEVVERTARLMAQWQAVGFCHGVMNTDNFSVLGLTLDYGPFGFMDGFDAGHICNHTDEGGRYAWDRQPQIGHWNCSKLLQATLPLLAEDGEAAVQIATAILDRYPPVYAATITRLWQDKLGLRSPEHGGQPEDAELINRWMSLLNRSHADFTRSFRHLSQVKTDADAPPLPLPLRDEILDVEGFDAWLIDYRDRLRGEQSNDAERAASMNAINPKYVLRNHLAQSAIERAEAGDFSEIDRLFRLLQKPFDEQPDFERYAAEPPPEARHYEVSCSS